MHDGRGDVIGQVAVPRGSVRRRRFSRGRAPRRRRARPKRYRAARPVRRARGRSRASSSMATSRPACRASSSVISPWPAPISTSPLGTSHQASRRRWWLGGQTECRAGDAFAPAGVGEEMLPGVQGVTMKWSTSLAAARPDGQRANLGGVCSGSIKPLSSRAGSIRYDRVVNSGSLRWPDGGCGETATFCFVSLLLAPQWTPAQRRTAEPTRPVRDRQRGSATFGRHFTLYLSGLG